MILVFVSIDKVIQCAEKASRTDIVKQVTDVTSLPTSKKTNPTSWDIPEPKFWDSSLARRHCDSFMLNVHFACVRVHVFILLK